LTAAGSLDAITETTEWLEHNQLAEKDEFDDKLKGLEALCNPIMTQAYSGAGATEGGSRQDYEPSPAGAEQGPKVEEVD
jgi:heat shock protein 1/8